MRKSIKKPLTERARKTVIKKGASIGANATIVCGHNIGTFAFVGAGTVVTKDVPDGDLAVARARQENKSGWAEKKLSGYIEKHSK